MPRATLPRPLAGRAFTVAEGRQLGMTADQLRRTSLRSPTRGVRASGPAAEALDVARRCAELLPALPADAVFCHVTALALLRVDLPLPDDVLGPLHVQVGPGRNRVRRAGVVGHRCEDGAPRTILLRGGLRVVLPEQAWIHLAATRSVADLVVVGDGLTRRRDPVCGIARLAEALAARTPGSRGRRRLAEALALVRPGTDSPMETRLRGVLVQGGLRTPHVNALARAPDGTVLARPDLSYPDEKIAIEYDGDVHRTDRSTWRRDIARRQSLEAHGWRVITCTADDVLQYPERPVAWVRAALDRPRRAR